MTLLCDNFQHKKAEMMEVGITCSQIIVHHQARTVLLKKQYTNNLHNKAIKLHHAITFIVKLANLLQKTIHKKTFIVMFTLPRKPIKTL